LDGGSGTDSIESTPSICRPYPSTVTLDRMLTAPDSTSVIGVNV
jgi:hypothetical protein